MSTEKNTWNHQKYNHFKWSAQQEGKEGNYDNQKSAKQCKPIMESITLILYFQSMFPFIHKKLQRGGENNSKKGRL